MSHVATAEAVELVIPAELRYLASARVLAASVAVEVGFDVDDLERVRIAVNELTTMLIEPLESSERVRLTVHHSPVGAPGQITVVGSVDDADESAAGVEVDELARRILSAVAMSFAVSDSGFVVTIDSAASPQPASSR